MISGQRLISVIVQSFVLIFTASFPVDGIQAEEKSYWLSHGPTKKPTCEGEANGKPIRAASNASKWVLVTAVLSCRDLGDSYLYGVEYMSVEINDSARARMSWPNLNFDAIALAIYAPKDGGQRIEWLYDEALPLKGTLSKESREKIYFGNLMFPKVPKRVLDAASNFTLYLTAENLPIVFGVL